MEKNNACPKCGKEKVEDISCPYCGVVYQRYKKSEVKVQQFTAAKSKGGGLFFVIIILMAGFGYATGQFSSEDKSPEQNQIPLTKGETIDSTDANLEKLTRSSGEYKIMLNPGHLKIEAFLPEKMPNNSERLQNPTGDDITKVYSDSLQAEAAVQQYHIWYVLHNSDLVTPDQLKEEIKFALQKMNGSVQTTRHLRTADNRLAFEVDFESIQKEAFVGRIRAIEVSENEILLVGFIGKDERSLFDKAGVRFVDGLTIIEQETVAKRNSKTAKRIPKETEEKKYYCGVSTRLPVQRAKIVNVTDIQKSLKQSLGCLTVMEIYSSRCSICKSIAPDVKELREKYSSKGVAFLGYSVDPSTEDFKNYLKNSKEDIPFNAKQFRPGLPRQDILDALKKLGVDWPGALPLFVLFDSDGSVLLRFTGSSDFDVLEKRISSLL
jgi:thiol-disulfide isomerase/thioredoxin